MHRRIRELAHEGAIQRPVRVDVRFDVLETVRQISERRAASALVFDGYELVGMLTEHDVVTRVVQRGRDPSETATGEVMTVAPLTIDLDATVDDALRAMRDHGVSHLAVCDGFRPVGVIALGDVLEVSARDLAEENQLLHEFIHGPHAREIAH